METQAANDCFQDLLRLGGVIPIEVCRLVHGIEERYPLGAGVAPFRTSGYQRPRLSQLPP